VKPAGFLVAGALLLPWHTAGAEKRGEDVSDYMARIERIHQGVQDLTWTGGLFRNEDFREIHAHPEQHLDAALDALRSADVAEPQKVIVALSMQKLPLEALVRFSERVLDDLEAGHISERVFEQAVFPTYDWNTALEEHYDDGAVQRLLARVAASPKVGERRKEIVRDVILTGRARQDVLQLREAGQIK
jgi:hypothetical protein